MTFDVITYSMLKNSSNNNSDDSNSLQDGWLDQIVNLLQLDFLNSGLPITYISSVEKNTPAPYIIFFNMELWTKISISAKGTTKVTIKLDESMEQNGDGVFEFFDDFKDGVIDTTKWTNNGISISTTDQYFAPSAYVDAVNKYMYANAIPDPTKNYIIEYFTKTADLNDFYFFCDSSGAGQMFRLEARRGEYQSGFAATSSWTSWNSPSGLSSVAPNGWYKVSISITGTSATGTIDGVGSTTYTISKNGGYIGIQSDGISSGDYWDNIIIRKYAENEPTIQNIEQIDSNTYEITIYNPNDHILTDFQIKIPLGTDIPSQSSYGVYTEEIIPSLYIRYFDGVTENQKFNFFAQINHNVKIGSPLNFHIHSVLLDEITEDITTTFKIKYAPSTIGEKANNTFEKTVEVVFSPDDYMKHKVIDFGTLLNVEKVSEVMICELERLDMNGYRIGVLFVDFHYIADSLGSETEWKK